MKALAGIGSVIAIEGFGALYYVLEQTTLSLAYTSISTIRKCPNIVDWDVRHQFKQTKQYTVNVLKFRTLVPRQKVHADSSLIRVFPVCFSDSIL